MEAKLDSSSLIRVSLLPLRYIPQTSLPQPPNRNPNIDTNHFFMDLILAPLWAFPHTFDLTVYIAEKARVALRLPFTY